MGLVGIAGHKPILFRTNPTSERVTCAQSYSVPRRSKQLEFVLDNNLAARSIDRPTDKVAIALAPLGFQAVMIPITRTAGIAVDSKENETAKLRETAWVDQGYALCGMASVPF
ncbi:hypothetical protein AJ80_07864 [Polytolypa hystricis UAMH7299]|uniref:Uncharacterized protein n=1 Tax=Polytolypa hystricis (strain UAMH7299) TaxID=1447883 RepID=A0A2B7XHR7_POLH7|nr:hypothetical protein AJ80_07864 [Polytolypa hystricis UAMH7299]